jgi:DNA-binding transcriptional LysR family regulator
MADRRLRVFHTVARLLSFTRAAETLHMTQPAVTFQVRQLEDSFSTRLFDRNHHKVILTEPGRIVYEYAERIFELYAEMEHVLKAATQDASGALTVGASPEAAEPSLLALLRDFKRARAGFELRLRVARAQDIVAMVGDGVIDVGAVVTQAPNAGLSVESCRADELVLIAPPKHPLACRERMRIHALLDYPFVGHETGCRAHELIAGYLMDAGLTRDALNVSLELGSMDAIKGAVEAGMGIAIVARSGIVRELEAGSLVGIRLDPPLLQSLTFLRRPLASRVVHDLLDFARRYVVAN